MSELQHEKEMADLEALHERQESSKKDGTIQKLESERQELTENVTKLSTDIQELNTKLKKQSEGMSYYVCRHSVAQFGTLLRT